MSSGGGKGGKKETETTIPDWVRGPAERNLRRAEQVQQLKYMPYTGPQVAAFNETQNAAMNNNIGAAKAFGLLDPNSTLSATTGTPTPTEYAGGFKGYGSIDIYDQALKELTARDPANMAAYNNLFGNAVPANNFARGGGGGGGGGGFIPSRPGLTPRQQYEAKMADVYSKVVIDDKGNTGYTGQGDAGGRAGVMDIGAPKYNYNVQVDTPKPKQYASQKTYKSKGGKYVNKNKIPGGR